MSVCVCIFVDSDSAWSSPPPGSPLAPDSSPAPDSPPDSLLAFLPPASLAPASSLTLVQPLFSLSPKVPPPLTVRPDPQHSSRPSAGTSRAIRAAIDLTGEEECLEEVAQDDLQVCACVQYSLLYAMCVYGGACMSYACGRTCVSCVCRCVLFAVLWSRTWRRTSTPVVHAQSSTTTSMP